METVVLQRIIVVVIIILLILVILFVSSLLTAPPTPPPIFNLPVNNEGEVISMCSCNDKTIIQQNLSAFVQNFESCGKTSMGDKQSGANCLVEKYSQALSTSCADCFGDYYSCAKNSCWKQCIFNPSGEDCKNCTIQYCGDNLLRCTQFTKAEVGFP
jgi:hypothetical protein